MSVTCFSQSSLSRCLFLPLLFCCFWISSATANAARALFLLRDEEETGHIRAAMS
ncbi:MAG: hypothetical protein ACREOZ_00710 [Gloeomargaritales cyanobacterium]